jgi:AcrR family transcriptional regulator
MIPTGHTMSAKGEQTRNKIIAAAKVLFYHRGYTQTSFSDIVSQTDIRRGNITHYFKTKDDILNAVVEQRASEYRDLFASWQAQHSEPKARLHSFVQMVASNKNDLTRYGCPIGTLNAELGKESCDLQNAARVLFDIFTEWLTLQFMELGNTRQAKARALHLLGRTEGISVIAHVYNDPALITAEVRVLQKWIDDL